MVSKIDKGKDPLIQSNLHCPSQTFSVASIPFSHSSFPVSIFSLSLFNYPESRNNSKLDFPIIEKGEGGSRIEDLVDGVGEMILRFDC